jgi:cytochrome c oxidase subunit I+III
MIDPAGAPPLPNPLPRPADELQRLQQAWQPPRGWRRLKSVNNTDVGLWYLGTALLFLLLAGVLALLMRAQLAVPENTLLSANTYNQVFTMHGTVMMFLFAVPAVEAVAVYLLPGMLGARDLPFPRLSAYSYWAYAIGGLGFFCSLFAGLAPDGGWFMYPPLSSTTYSPGLGADFWLLGIGFIEISAIAGAVELIVGILFTRAPGMTLAHMPVFAWAMLVVGFMIVFAFPAVMAGTALLELERAFDWPFFIAERGGDPLLWQHLFWFFGHPEVYIIFLPATGLVSMMVPALAQVPLAGHRAVVAALVAVGVLSFALWLHHMFTAGLGAGAAALVSAASMAIAVPAAVQMFAWFATVRRGRLGFTTPALFLLGFFSLFTLGGLTGVMVAVLPFDWQAHDSYFIVAHLHYVLIGGMVFPLFAAIHHWLPLVNGHAPSERGGRWAFALMFVGFNLAFFPMHVAGLAGMPRRVATYADGLGWNGLNFAATVGAGVLAAGIGVFGVNVLLALRRPRRAHGNPWRASSLEWLAMDRHGTRSIPQVGHRDPLWARPGVADEVDAGRHWLPGTASGGRETLVTTPLQARLSHLMLLPGDSWLPFVAACGTAGFFLLLTVKLNALAAIAGLVALIAILGWLWQTDRPPFAAQAAVGHGVMLAVGARGTAAPAWWAMVVLLAVLASVFASLVFAHLHVAMAAVSCPPPGARLPAAPWAWLAAALWGASAAALAWAARRIERPLRFRGGLLLATVCAAAAFIAQWAGHADAGLVPSADAWSATVAALLGFQGLQTAVLLLMGSHLLARSAAGRLSARSRMSPPGRPKGEYRRAQPEGTPVSLDVCKLFWIAAAVQGLLLELVVHGLPRLLQP